MTRASPRRSLPLVAWIAAGVVASVAVSLGAVAVVLSMESSGGVSRTEARALLIGAIVGILACATVTAWAWRVARGLRELHRDALSRLGDPILRTERASAQWEAVRASQELLDLARVLDALHLRARLAGEDAEHARRTAENASAGMFELLSGLVAAEEGTRGQLSAELHDTVAQSLMAGRAILSDPELNAKQLANAREYVEDAEEQVRAVMARTRPPELRDGDLATAVSGLRGDLQRRYLLDVHLSWPSEPHPLPLVSAVTVYRFFQEALLNVVKHADVDEAWASLSIDDDGLVAVVRDQGPGFVNARVASSGGRHVGLTLLRDRARLAGGSLEIDSTPGTGTALSLRLPLNDPVSGAFRFTP